MDYFYLNEYNFVTKLSLSKYYLNLHNSFITSQNITILLNNYQIINTGAHIYYSNIVYRCSKIIFLNNLLELKLT